MRIRYRAKARSELEEIYNYLEQRNRAGAQKVMRAILESVQFIAENPLAAPRTNDPTVRVRIVRQYRYKIFYSFDGQEIDVLHVRHGARQTWKGR